MHAARYRLRFTTGVALTSATYGSGTYGAGTYGEQASDPLSSLRYYLVPWPGGYLPDPSWVYRVGDTDPDFRVQILADNERLDLTGIAYALLVLTNTDGSTNPVPWIYDLTVTTLDSQDWLTRAWLPTDLAKSGTYRAAVVIVYDSGRRLTVPVDDRHNFVINPNPSIPEPDTPIFRWGTARWSYAYWSRETP